uniref:hypothetical protein n=1 Tax=Myxococcus vastator TaxID=2709664 RepID=UPI0019670C59
MKHTLLLIALVAGFLPGAARAAPDKAKVGTDWRSGGVVDTGGGYEAYSGMPRRHVVDFEVPGSVGKYPLRCARSLVIRQFTAEDDTTIIPLTPKVSWMFEHFYSATLRLNGGIDVRYPNGTSTVFRRRDAAATYFTPPAGQDRLVVVGGKPVTLRLSDGGTVHFTELQTESVIPGENPEPFTAYVSTRIVDPHGVALTIEPYKHHGPRRVTDASGRWLEFTWSGSGVSKVRSSAGQEVGYTLSPQVYWEEPVITRAQYQDHSFATYKYGTRPETYFNLPLELNDTRSSARIQRTQYTYRESRRTIGLVVHTESTLEGGVISTYLEEGGLSAAEIRADGSKRTWLYDAWVPPGAPPGFHYDGTLQAETDSSGRTYGYAYGLAGAINYVRNPGGHGTTLSQEPVLGRVTRVTHPDGAYSTVEYSDLHNPYLISAETDERGKTTRYDRFENGAFKPIV